jgi:diguanylate cyclase (GGDEF)-like protein
MNLPHIPAPDLLRRFADRDLATLARLVVTSAFQPIVEMGSGAVFGHESLLRGFDRLGFSSPLEFLDYVEQHGQLMEIEQLMAARALTKFAATPNFREKTLFLNLDVRLIADGEAFAGALLKHMRANRIPPSSVCFELSERFDNASIPQFAELVAYMRQAGFKLAIDDYGAGHGEMNLLCDYQVDYLKIDRHMVAGIDTHARKRHLFKNTVNMAHALGIRIIAEGVETEAEYLTCRDLGADLVQGWFIARPEIEPEKMRHSFPELARLGFTPGSGTDEALIRRLMERVPAIREDDHLDRVFDLFRNNPSQTFFPVLNANGEPRGVIREQMLKAYIYQPFGRDLLHNPHYHRAVSQFVEPAPVVGLDADADQLASIFTNMEGNDCVLLTENLRYAGVVSPAAMVRLFNEKQLQHAREQNPLTGLPGNRAIHEHLLSRGRDTGRLRYFCYGDFDHFKPFNDVYGFSRGDMAISLFAAQMRRVFLEGEVFLGHVGGDDFFIGTADMSRERLEQTLERLIHEFAEDAARLYAPEDRARGGLEAEDRAGARAFFPLLRCSMAVLEVPEGQVLSDISQLSRRIAELKRDAKRSERALVFGGMEREDLGVVRLRVG